jgi:hypothetical protein
MEFLERSLASSLPDVPDAPVYNPNAFIEEGF